MRVGESREDASQPLWGFISRNGRTSGDELDCFVEKCSGVVEDQHQANGWEEARRQAITCLASDAAKSSGGDSMLKDRKVNLPVEVTTWRSSAPAVVRRREQTNAILTSPVADS
jgi:hypothetical protein